MAVLQPVLHKQSQIIHRPFLNGFAWFGREGGPCGFRDRLQNVLERGLLFLTEVCYRVLFDVLHKEAKAGAASIGGGADKPCEVISQQFHAPTDLQMPQGAGVVDLLFLGRSRVE